MSQVEIIPRRQSDIWDALRTAELFHESPPSHCGTAPQATIDLLADAVGKMLEDPRYIADAEKIFGARIKTFVGADAAKILEGAMNAPPEVQSFLKELLKQG